MSTTEGENNKTAAFGDVLDSLTSAEVIGALSNIAGLASDLQHSPDGGGGGGGGIYTPQEAGALIEIQSRRTATLIESVLIAQQINNGTRKVVARPYSLRPALEQVVGELSPLCSGYATKLKLGSRRRVKPVLADETLVLSALRSVIEGVIRTTASKKIFIDTISNDSRLFLHIIDKDVSYEDSAERGAKNVVAGSHTIALPSFYVGGALVKAMGGEFRIVANKGSRHIDLVFKHSVQLALEL